MILRMLTFRVDLLRERIEFVLSCVSRGGFGL
jgi:hypothetical protein